MSVTRKGQVPSRTPVPGALPETESKEPERPSTVVQRCSPGSQDAGGAALQKEVQRQEETHGVTGAAQGPNPRVRAEAHATAQESTFKCDP